MVLEGFSSLYSHSCTVNTVKPVLRDTCDKSTHSGQGTASILVYSQTLIKLPLLK